MKIAAVGDNCMDVYENLNQAFPGGNPVNVAVYLVRLGEKASYTGCVGDDKYGKIMINALQGKGVDVSHVQALHGNTAITKVELIDGERVFGDYFEGVLSKFKLTEEDIDFLCQHDLVHTGLWGMIENDLWKIKEKGTPISFDFATKLEDSVIEKAISYVDYAFFAYEQDDDFIRDYMKKIYVKGPKLIIVTLGENGSLVYDGTQFIKYGIITVDVVDTMGAGDSFIAGFMKGILEKKTIQECMHMGTANSSETLKYTGAW